MLKWGITFHSIFFWIYIMHFLLQSLFFQQLSYLMYDVHAKTAPKRLLDNFAKINRKHHYNTLLSAKECFSVKFSGPEKIINSLTRIAVFIGNSIPLSVKTLNISNFRKKIKSLLLNVLRNEDNYLNVNYLIEYFTKLTWYVVYTSSCNFSLFQITKYPVLELICTVFLSVCYCISFLFSYVI